MTDYFEDDRFDIKKDHELFKLAADVIIVNYERYIKQTEKSKYGTETTRKDQID